MNWRAGFVLRSLACRQLRTRPFTLTIIAILTVTKTRSTGFSIAWCAESWLGLSHYSRSRPIRRQHLSFRNTDHAGCRPRVALELAGSLVLHVLVFFFSGTAQLSAVCLAAHGHGTVPGDVARSICEHHHVISGDDWTNARSIVTSRVTELAWSNVNYHLEHHLYPEVPFHKLPALRRLLALEFALHSSFLAEAFSARQLR